jgi:hypothetical protein
VVVVKPSSFGLHAFLPFLCLRGTEYRYDCGCYLLFRLLLLLLLCNCCCCSRYCLQRLGCIVIHAPAHTY